MHELRWPEDFVNRIICGDCLEVLKWMPDECVDIVITSPPYNAGKEYERRLSEEEYTSFLADVFTNLKRVLKPDGRFCWNVPYQMRLSGVGEPFSPWECSMKAIRKVGLKFRDNITWNQLHSDNDTAWGSWMSASAPWLRHMTEAIIIGYKKSWKKLKRGESDITRDEFLKFVLDLWSIPTASRNVGHPCPFPEELAYRCIKLFSYVRDIILDPFCGSGTTCLVAIRLNRCFIGIDIKPEYVRISKKRVEPELKQGRLF